MFYKEKSRFHLELTSKVSAKENLLKKRVVTERYLSDLVKVYGKHPVSTDGRTWYLTACRFLKLKHHIHSLLAKKRKALSKELYIQLRTEVKALMTNFPVEYKAVN